MTQASSLEKEKAKVLEKAALAKASPTSQGFWPCRMGRWTRQVSLSQRSRSWKQASKAEAMVHKLQGELDQTLEKVKSKLSRKKQTTALGHLAALKKVEAQLQEGVLAPQLLHSSLGKGSKGGEEGAEPLGGQSPQCGQLQEEQKVSIFCSASLEKHVKLGKAKQLYIPASQACLSVWPCL